MRRLVPLLLFALLALPVASARATPPPLRWTTPHLADATPPFASPTVLDAVACAPGGAGCLGVGRYGTVAQLNALTSADSSTIGLDHDANLLGVACPASTLCLATEPDAVLVSTRPFDTPAGWRHVAVPVPGGGAIDGIDCASSTLCVAWTSNREVEVATDPAGAATAWHAEALAAPVSTVACVPASTTCVASLRSTGGATVAVSTDPGAGASSWTATPAPGIDPVSALACPSTTLCVGVDQPGNIVTSTDPTAGGASFVASTPPSGANSIVGIGCENAGACVAGLSNGTIISSEDPAAGGSSYVHSRVLDPAGFATRLANPVACPPFASGQPFSPCFISDRHGGVAAVSPGPPANATVATGLGGITALTGLACPGRTLCVGVDSGGGIISSFAPFVQTAWTRVVEPTARRGLTAVSCPSVHFCAATTRESRVLTSDAPAYERWHATEVPPSALASIDCPTASFCIAGADDARVLVSTQPDARWHAISLGRASGNQWRAVACPSAQLCIAGDDARGQIATSTDPTAGHTAWHIAVAAPAIRGREPGINALSCPTTTFCLAADTLGAVDWSTHPTGGLGAWHATRIDDAALVAVSCRSADFCLAADRAGHTYLSTDPTGGAGAWHETTIALDQIAAGRASQRRLTALACAPRTLCLAGDAVGAVFPGRTG
jgi:hypothetical protein